MKYVVTILPTLKKSAFKELNGIDEAISIRHMDFDIFIVKTEEPNFVKSLKDSIFVRHVHPVNKELELTGIKDLDLKEILSALIGFVDTTGRAFMVQCRKVGKDLPYNSKDIEVFIGSSLERQQGGRAVFDDTQVISDPDIFVVSILVLNKTACLGFSKITDNLEPYPNPARVYSKWNGTICRAEFKLREAVRKFNIKLEGGMKALDLGAAPGGWSKVLQDYGLKVIAIDPADLDKRLIGIEHFKGKSEDFITTDKFDILVNDMNMDPRDSARITLSMKRFLKRGANVVFTAKLVNKNYERLISETKDIFKEAFNILSIKNLFHNHEEVTFYLELKSPQLP